MAGAGAEQNAGLMPVGVHALKDRRLVVVQIEQEVASVLFTGVGLEIDVIALVVAQAQEADHGGTRELAGGPQILRREQASAAMVNQTQQIDVAGYRRQLAANRPEGDKESAVHDSGCSMRPESRPAKEEVFTLQKSGSFYFALTLNVLNV
jgi:hypothetical protein